MMSVTVSDFIVFIVIMCICATMISIAISSLNHVVLNVVHRCAYVVHIYKNNTIIVDKICT